MPYLLWEEFQAPADQDPIAIENYAMFNKRNGATQRITTLETQQVQFVVITTCREYSRSLSTDLHGVDLGLSTALVQFKLKKTVVKKH